MVFHVVWTQTATLDLKEIVQFIAADDPRTAKRFGLLIVEKNRRGFAVPLFRKNCPGKENKSYKGDYYFSVPPGI